MDPGRESEQGPQNHAHGARRRLCAETSRVAICMYALYVGRVQQGGRVAGQFPQSCLLPASGLLLCPLLFLDATGGDDMQNGIETDPHGLSQDSNWQRAC